MSKLKTILLVCLIGFTSLLVRQTLKIQHSCHPMLHSGTLPTECQIAAKDNFNSHTQKELKTSEQPIQIPQNISKPKPHNVTYNSKVTEPEISENVESASKPQSNRVGQFVNEHSDDILGGVAGIAGGAAIVAAAGATAVFSLPVAGAVLVGLGIWYTIRTVL